MRVLSLAITNGEGDGPSLTMTKWSREETAVALEIALRLPATIKAATIAVNSLFTDRPHIWDYFGQADWLLLPKAAAHFRESGFSNSASVLLSVSDPMGYLRVG